MMMLPHYDKADTACFGSHLIDLKNLPLCLDIKAKQQQEEAATRSSCDECLVRLVITLNPLPYTLSEPI